VPTAACKRLAGSRRQQLLGAAQLRGVAATHHKAKAACLVRHSHGVIWICTGVHGKRQ
jgi:hypothetical protein